MKSHVSMAQHQCVICLERFDTNEILLRKDLRPVLETKTLTGHGICPKCQAQINQGFIALVETRDPNNGRSTVGVDVARSGNFAFLRREAFDHVFDQPCPEHLMIFVEPGVLDALKGLQAPDEVGGETQDG